MEVNNKIAIVTGASEGIGLALSRALTREGARVVLAARSEDKLKEIEKELPGSLAVAADLRKPEDIARLVKLAIEKFGRVDILVNNAGQGIYGPVEMIDIDQYKEVLELNLFAVIRAMQAVIPHMRSQGGGIIVNISSMLSKQIIPGLAPYASMKYAINALSLTARMELAKDNIIVIVFHPKVTVTHFGLNAINPRTDGRETGVAGPDTDTAEDVAWHIVDLIRSEQAEMMM